MNLPFDASTLCREKYLDETPMFANWFVFGTSSDGAFVDLADGMNDVITKLSIQKAEKIIQARDAFCKVLREQLALQ